MTGGGNGEAVAELQCLFGLSDGFATIEVGTAGVGPGVGAEVETVAGTQGETGLAVELGAVAPVGLTGVAGLLFEMAELQVALVLGGSDLDAGLARSVVKDKVVMPPCPLRLVASS